MNDTVMQDSQDPYEANRSTEAGPSSSYVHKERSEEQRQLNKRRNRRAQEDHIELYNITDPDTTPSDTPDDESYYCIYSREQVISIVGQKLAIMKSRL